MRGAAGGEGIESESERGFKREGLKEGEKGSKGRGGLKGEGGGGEGEEDEGRG